MKQVITIAAIILFSGTAYAKALVLDPSYVQADGAILTLPNSPDSIDPYFPTLALLRAHDNGFNISELGNGWINWMLARQGEDGLFPRFCREDDNQEFKPCRVADADDAMMALWIELLYRMVPTNKGMPETWKNSLEKAEAQLDSLYDKQNNIYLISKENQVGLLMDNAEIYSALERAGDEALRIGSQNQAELFHHKAAVLKEGIVQVFWDKENKRWRPSTQILPEETFYPHHVVQLFEMIYYFNRPSNTISRAFYNIRMKKVYKTWMKDHRTEWFGLIGKDYPWGLIAVLAVNRNDMETAICWREKAASERGKRYWDVLDETAFQIIEDELHKEFRKDIPKCSGM